MVYIDKKMRNAIFLRAERRPDGARTFRLIEGEPLQTSYGEDLYDRVFKSECPPDVDLAVGVEAWSPAPGHTFSG